MSNSQNKATTSPSHFNVGGEVRRLSWWSWHPPCSSLSPFGCKSLMQIWMVLKIQHLSHFLFSVAKVSCKFGWSWKSITFLTSFFWLPKSPGKRGPKLHEFSMASLIDIVILLLCTKVHHGRKFFEGFEHVLLESSITV